MCPRKVLGKDGKHYFETRTAKDEFRLPLKHVEYVTKVTSWGYALLKHAGKLCHS